MPEPKNLDGQINTFLALRGHTRPDLDYWQIMSEMMEEINHWRMVAKYPIAGSRPRGRQHTAHMDRIRYQHMMGYLAFKHDISGEEAAEIIAAHSMSVDGGKRTAKSVLDLASGWKHKHYYATPPNLFRGTPRWVHHEEFLQEAIELTGDPDYFPDQIRNFCKSE